MSSYPKVRLNNGTWYATGSEAAYQTGSDSKGRKPNNGLEFFKANAFYTHDTIRPDGLGQFGVNAPHGAGAIFEISMSAVSRSGGLIQTASNGLTTQPGSFISFANDTSTLQFLFLSESVSGSRISGSNEIQVISPKPSRYKYVTASLVRGDESGDAVASRINNAFSMSYARILAASIAGTTTTSGSAGLDPSASLAQNIYVANSLTGSVGSNPNSRGYNIPSDYYSKLPWSASLHGSVVKIFSERTGSVRVTFNEALTSSFGFSITETQKGFGSRYARYDSPLATPTASFRLTVADYEAQGVMFTAHDPKNMVKNHASSSHITALYISRSGAIGIQTEDPKVELGVSGSISASGDIFGVTGSFHYITASVVDVNADTVRIGGEKMNRTLLQNLKDGFDSDTRATQPGANFKSGIRTAGNITASGDISASSTINGNVYTIQNQTLASRHGSGHITLGNTSDRLTLNGSTTEIGSSVTASGDISASGTISGSILFANSLNIGSSFSVSSGGSITTLNNLNAGNSSTFDSHTITGRTTFTGNITASNNISSSGNLYANNIGSIYDNYIYLTPIDFDHLKDKVAITIAGEVESNGGYLADNNARGTYYAQKMIPKGYKATHVIVEGSSTSDNFVVHSSSYDVGTAAEVGSATSVGTEKAITNVIGGSGTYVSIEWGSRGNTDVYGGYIKLERND